MKEKKKTKKTEEQKALEILQLLSDSILDRAICDMADGYVAANPMLQLRAAMLSVEEQFENEYMFRSMGSRGGSAKTKAKAAASRRNGKLGGRPRKKENQNESR